MPVLVLPENAEYWFQSSTEQLVPLFETIDESMIDVKAA
mgnify:CR=1 FL=1